VTLNEISKSVNGELDPNLKQAFPITIITTIITAILQGLIERKCPAQDVAQHLKRHSPVAKRMIRKSIRAVENHPAVATVDGAIAKVGSRLTVKEINTLLTNLHKGQT